MISKVYPDNVGLKLSKTNFPFDPNFYTLKIPKKTIIRIFGLSGVGKGRLSQHISASLKLPNLDTGKIFRAVTYSYIKLGLGEINSANTKQVFDNLDIRLNNDQFQIFFGKKELLATHLKTTEIDSVITNYSKNIELRQQTYAVILDFIINKVETACLTDARGASEDYIDKAEALGYTIIRIMVDVDFDTKLARYYEEIKRLEENKLGRTLRVTERENMYKKLWQVMKTRDEKDLAIANSGQWTLITHDSAILDTGEYNIEESFKLVLSYIASKVELQVNVYKA